MFSHPRKTLNRRYVLRFIGSVVWFSFCLMLQVIGMYSILPLDSDYTQIEQTSCRFLTANYLNWF